MRLVGKGPSEFERSKISNSKQKNCIVMRRFVVMIVVSEALANTELPHFLRVAVRAADGGAVAVSVVAHSVEHRRAYQPVKAVYRSQEGGTSAVQVARSRIARLIRLGVWSLPPPRLPDGSPPVADSALIVEAPQGAFISVDGVVRGEISEHNMTRIETKRPLSGESRD